MLFNEITLVLAGKVHAPAYGELELMTVLNGLFKNIDTLCVLKTDKRTADNRLESLYQRLVYHLVEELKVVLAVVQSPLNAVFDEVFLEVHQVVEIDECNLRLYHPELGQVARSV